MTGVVLCGGRSIRMGTDKGLLTIGKLTWAEVAAEKLLFLKVPVVISVNPDQFDAYSKVFSPQKLVLDDQTLSVKGPLLGLLSVYKQFPKEDLVVLACDMIEADRTLLFDLLEHYKQTSCEAYVYKTGETVQPLCGIYTSKAFENIDHLLQLQQLKRFSMMHVLECINTCYVNAKEPSIHLFNNYNSAAGPEADS